MTHPANKNHRDSAKMFAARNKVKGGVSERTRPLRNSPLGRRLQELRRQR